LSWGVNLTLLADPAGCRRRIPFRFSSAVEALLLAIRFDLQGGAAPIVELEKAGKASHPPHGTGTLFLPSAFCLFNIFVRVGLQTAIR
jgi:hypothetical protein